MSDPTTDHSPAPAQQGALSPERLDEIEWEHAAITDRLDNGGAIRTDALRAAYERHMADLLPEVIRLREQHAARLAMNARLAVERDEARQQLAAERAATARLRDQIATARAQLDAWQDNAPGATVQAAAATLAAGPGPGAPPSAQAEVAMRTVQKMHSAPIHSEAPPAAPEPREASNDV